MIKSNLILKVTKGAYFKTRCFVIVSDESGNEKWEEEGNG